MQQSPLNDILHQILTIIHFTEDKEKFVTEFDELNRIETMVNLLETLPKDIQKKLEAIDDESVQAEEIKKYVPEEDYKEEFLLVSSEALAKLLEDTIPTLTLDQKQQIAKILPQT